MTSPTNKGQDEAVQEDEAEDGPFAAGLFRGYGCHHDALRIDDLAHHAARAVAGCNKHGIEPQLAGGDVLQTAEPKGS